MSKRVHWSPLWDKSWDHAPPARRAVQPWDAVFARVRVFRLPDRVYSHTVTDAGLDELEVRLGCRLPTSYREFMRRFGPGELGPWVALHPPTAEDGVARLTEDRCGSVAQEPDYYPNAPFLTRLVYFASSGGGDGYAWDPHEVTEANPLEYQCYYLERAREQDPVPAGRSFAEFLHWAQDQYRHLDEDDVEEPAAGVQPIPLRPWHVRVKAASRQNDVHTWLRHNGRAARLLARAIRDRGQVDAFPILADALEEGGCDNADLLAACRTGDPDIDGGWAIQALLD